MKNLFSILVLSFLMAAPLHASEIDGRTDKGWLEREGIVISRGFKNLVSIPFEFVRTPREEKKIHPKAWPLTAPPRFFLNAMVRLTSGVHDVLFFPLYVPFTDDISPWTEPFDLPDYAWEKT